MRARIDSCVGSPVKGVQEIILTVPRNFRFRAGQYLEIELPDGLAEPLLIIAGGTGGAQAMGLLDQLLGEPQSQPVTLLWCADRSDDLYCRSWLESLDRAWLTAECIVDASREATNLGLQWLRGQAATLGHHQIILSGSPGFVYAAVDVLEASGISQQRMASDMFTFSPRESSRESPGPGQPPATA